MYVLSPIPMLQYDNNGTLVRTPEFESRILQVIIYLKYPVESRGICGVAAKMLHRKL